MIRWKGSAGGVFAFKEGTLYPILHALEAKGLVESYWIEAQGARRRKYYRATDTGKLQLQEKKIPVSVIQGQKTKMQPSINFHKGLNL